jgi:anti-sigma regulatory factor (Ser/Thr protein kinase)
VSFQHEVLLYDGLDGFMAGTLPYLRDGREAEDSMMVAVPAERIRLLREALGEAAHGVRFVDMVELGRNPGRIIPAWRDFLGSHQRPGHAIRGIGEPAWAGRSDEELVECQLHEALLNVEFADADGFRLLCPYDRSALDEAVVREACCIHPSILDGHGRRRSPAYRNGDELLAPFDAPLPPPRSPVEVMAYDRRSLDDLRTVVADRGAAARLEVSRAADLVLAVNEAAANSVRHGGGNGVLRMWEEDDALICEVRDRGLVVDPLVGRRKPAPHRSGGWGVYIAHQLCDLVQLRSDRWGTVVRLYVRRA